MHLEFLVEEYSSQVFLELILPKILDRDITFNIHPFQGKPDLLKKLPARLKGYKAWITDDWKIVILLDRDREDCQKLKHKLEKIASDVDLLTKSSATNKQKFQVLNRIIIEELEAWFFGDIEAIIKAYPRINKNLANKSKYRDPDAIKGGTWEALETILQKAGYHLGGLDKSQAAREIASYQKKWV